MDYDSSSKFISSLAKFLQSLCNGYVEFDNGVQVIGHLYVSVDTGKTIDYILNEKVCKTDENSVTFISNSFHAQPAEKPKPPGKKLRDSDRSDPKPDSDGTEIASGNQGEPRSTNFGTVPSRGNQNSPHSQGTKRPYSPTLKQSRGDASPSKLGRVSPRHKKNRTESLDPNLPSHASNPASENSISSETSPAAQNSDLPYNESYQPSFFDPGDEENSITEENEERDIKPNIDTDVTFIKEEFASSSGSQSGSQNRDRGHGDDSDSYGGYSSQVFPGGGYAAPASFGSSVSGSQRSNFNPASDRASNIYNTGPGSSQMEGGESSGDPSVLVDAVWRPNRPTKRRTSESRSSYLYSDFDERTRPSFNLSAKSSSLLPYDVECKKCTFVSRDSLVMSLHKKTCSGKRHLTCNICSKVLSRYDSLAEHMRGIHGIGSRVQCRFCGKDFKYRPQMYQHQAVCTARPKVESDAPFSSPKFTIKEEGIESKISFPYDVTMSVDMDTLTQNFLDSKPGPSI